jgi:hypothetical protein
MDILKVLAYLDLEVREIKQIEGTGLADFTSFKIKKLNKTTRGIFGTIVVPVADYFDNNLQVGVRLLKKQGGEYRQMPFKLPPKNLCDFFNEDDFFMPDVVAASDVPSPLPCPAEVVKILKPPSVPIF